MDQRQPSFIDQQLSTPRLGDYGPAELAKQARAHYDRARAAQRSDDWATYGTEMRRLGEVLRQLEAARGPRP